MKDKDIVIELISNKKETESCDFKRDFYHKTKKHDMIKDIASFANSTIPGDKYIIFNIDDVTREIGEISMESIPDVSEINGLLREYCEPHIDIKLDSFEYKKSCIAYIKINCNNLNRPYVIKKDFTKDKKTYLHQGQIYIRKNSDNFRANRQDLDEIYESREKCKIEICSPISVCEEFKVNKARVTLYYFQFIFNNESKRNYLLNKIEINFCSPKNSFSTDVKFIDEINKKVFCTSDEISTTPFSISAHTSMKKTLYFALSASCTEVMKEVIDRGDKYVVSLTASDLNHKIINSEKVDLSFKSE